jgi:hypothetical protein
MVARTAFTQLGYRYSLLAATIAFLVLFFVAPPILVAGGLVGGSWLTALSAAGAWLLQSATLLPVVGHERVPVPYALSLPVASALYGAMTVVSGWRHLRRRGVSWRGRRVS